VISKSDGAAVHHLKNGHLKPVQARSGTYHLLEGFALMPNEPTPKPQEPPVKDPQPYKDPPSQPNGPGEDVPMHDPVTPNQDLPKM
jgi:hypothetical protein